MRMIDHRVHQERDEGGGRRTTELRTASRLSTFSSVGVDTSEALSCSDCNVGSESRVTSSTSTSTARGRSSRSSVGSARGRSPRPRPRPPPSPRATPAIVWRALALTVAAAALTRVRRRQVDVGTRTPAFTVAAYRILAELVVWGPATMRSGGVARP